MYRADTEPVSLPDGDKIVLHDDCPTGWKPRDQVALLIHGLAGCHGSGYMMRVAEGLRSRGIRAFRMDMRGVGAAAGMARFVPHAGRTEDAVVAVEHIARLCPEAPLSMVGFSMGGNIVLGALAKAGRRGIGNLIRAIAVTPPVDLSRCCRELRKGLSRVYDRYLTQLIVRNWRNNGGKVPEPLPRSIYDFDDNITAPLSGYRDAEDYYRHASSGRYLQDITIPTRILAARDDPIVSYGAIESAQRSAHVELFVTESGGHMGYISDSKFAAHGRWLDKLVIDWLCHWDEPVR